MLIKQLIETKARTIVRSAQQVETNQVNNECINLAEYRSEALQRDVFINELMLNNLKANQALHTVSNLMRMQIDILEKVIAEQNGSN